MRWLARASASRANIASSSSRAWRAIDAGVSYRVIPWQMGVVAKLMRLLPDALFDRVVAGRGRKKRRGA